MQSRTKPRNNQLPQAQLRAAAPWLLQTMLPTQVQVSYHSILVHLVCELGVKAFAKRNNIDIHSITGTGKDGRVLMEDAIDSLNRNAGGKVKSTPAVRAFAKQNNVNIGQVKGTGFDGRITKDDILSFMNQGAQSSRAPVSG